MPGIQTQCSQGHALTVAAKYAGRRVKCPRCQDVFRVPPDNRPMSDAERAVPTPPTMPAAAVGQVTLAPPILAAAVTPPPLADRVAAPRIVEQRGGVRGYRAEPSRVHTVYLIGVGLLALVLFQLAPTSAHLNPATAPNWARAVMLLAVVQTAFAVWLVSLPDWSTVRVAMMVMAGVTTLYGVALGVTVITPTTKPLLWDLNDVRDKASLWCATVLLLAGLMTYVCGRVAFRWRKAYRSAL